ncbi:YdcF family protein [Paenibacillus sp. FSL K6-3166]|uniref:YdcF family protein n=1 Tax=unclassified Paenibacillus TaxID=185978 RepID=UPI00117FF192|nr:YdcF family protein [Paenibacillus sp. VTT E-133291]
MFILFLALYLFLIAGRFLNLSQPLKEADTIIVLSGGQDRVEKALELYNAGYATYLILSNAKESTSSSGDMVQTALALGIPQDAIYTENTAESTYQNAEFTLPIMKEHNFTSAIVVSSEFHMRRVKFLFDRVYKKSDIELTYVGSASGYNAKRWWSDRKSRETTFNEYIKLMGNTFGYNGPEAKSTLDQIKNWFR